MRKKTKIFQGLALAYLVVFVGLSPVSIAQAQLNTNRPAQTSLPHYNKGVDKTIAEYLCVPSDQNVGTALYDCLGKVYRVGIMVGALMMVFFTVWAGYMYIVGGESAKTKAKSMITGTLTGMALILGSYALLRFLNPDLVLYKPIQPPIFTGVGLPRCEDVGFGKNCIISTGPGKGQVYQGGSGIVGGYNIGAYATDPNHEAAVARIFNSLSGKDFSKAENITAYMKSIAPSTPLTGDMVLSSSRKYNVDAKMIVTMMQQDSSFGTVGKGARTHNPGNVGNDDTGRTVDYGTWEKGVDAVASWLNRHRA